MPYDPQRHGPLRVVGPGFHERVWQVVRQVPAGFVTTYGDVGAALGLRAAARHVGFALAALPPRSDVPWHRVVNGRGELSTGGAIQRRRLAREGIRTNERGRIVDFRDIRLPVDALRAPK